MAIQKSNEYPLEYYRAQLQDSLLRVGVGSSHVGMVLRRLASVKHAVVEHHIIFDE